MAIACERLLPVEDRSVQRVLKRRLRTVVLRRRLPPLESTPKSSRTSPLGAFQSFAIRAVLEEVEEAKQRANRV